MSIVDFVQPVGGARGFFYTISPVHNINDVHVVRYHNSRNLIEQCLKMCHYIF